MMIFNSKIKIGTIAPSKIDVSTQNSLRASDPMVKLLFVMISMVQKPYQKVLMILVMDFMIQLRELFANTMENLNVILNLVRNNGLPKSVATTQDNSKMTSILMDHRIRLSRR